MKKGQFSRDWSLLKLARTWEPRDIGGEVVERVMQEGTPEAVMGILHVISDIGFEDGEKAKERMPPFMQRQRLLRARFWWRVWKPNGRTKGTESSSSR
ncbi:hypothetical protein [Methanogenium cariaci]|uniref:hypothetical protein n=1 Tax=Methanogenium cariaci TaxID=2197 RepID=UPI0007838B62|nr:hypothetical protein [Methanogenium cariaci]